LFWIRYPNSIKNNSAIKCRWSEEEKRDIKKSYHSRVIEQAVWWLGWV